MSRTRFLLAFALLFTTACGVDDADPVTASAVDDRVVPLSLGFDFVDGADVARSIEFVDAALVEDGLRLRYRALVDGQPRSIEYAQYGTDAPLEITIDGPDARAALGLFIDGDRADFYIAGTRVGAFAWTVEGTSFTTPLQSDELSFALLSLFPHQVAGLEPATLFAGARYGDADDGYGSIQQGIFAKLFRAKVKCTKNRIYSCSGDICAQTAEGCACGGACGTIACCSGGCTVDESVTYSGGVGAGL